MTPFFDVGTLYEGPAARALGGADISFFIGLPVAGLLYYLFSRSVDAGGAAWPGALSRRAVVRVWFRGGRLPRVSCKVSTGQPPGAGGRTRRVNED